MEHNGRRNYIRLCILILDLGRDTLLHLLKQKRSFKCLAQFIYTNKNYLKKRLSYSKKQLLYPRETIHEGSFYNNLDFNLLYVLLKGILKDERDLLTNIENLCKAKNALFRNPRGVYLDVETFEKAWTQASKAVQFLCSDYLRDDIRMKVSEIYELQLEPDVAKWKTEDTTVNTSYEDFEIETWPTKRVYKITRRTEMYLELSNLVFNFGSDVFRALLYERLPPSRLSTTVSSQVHILREFRRCQDLTWEIRLERKYKAEKEVEPWHCYDNFDFTLLYRIIRRLGNIPQHSKGWGKQPTEKDFSFSANIDRLNGIKQKLMNYRLGTSFSGNEFDYYKHEANCALQEILKRLAGVCSVQGKIGDIVAEKTSLLKILNDKEQIIETTNLGRSNSQPGSFARLDSSTSFSEDVDSLRLEDTIVASSSQISYNFEEAFNRFKIQHKDKLFKCFLGYNTEDKEHGDIFIMAYLKCTLTKSKYWNKFENMDVLNVDCNFVGTEAAEAMYSKKSMENPLEFEKMEEMKQTIGDNSDYLMKKHSNLEIISASSVISRKGEIIVEPCIVLYCRTKGVIPVGEEKFPDKLGEYSIDVREGFFQWAPGDELYPAPNVFHNPLKLGCNIGLRGKGHSGTLGGFVETQEGIGFLTCAHVLYDQRDLEDLNKPRSDDFVVQPADSQVTNPSAHNRTCGKVLKFSFDPEGPVGIDAAVVSIIDRNPIQGQFTGLCQNSLEKAGFDRREPLRYNSGKYRQLNEKDMDRRVIKSGATTGLTRGVFKFSGAAVNVFDTDLYLDPSTQMSYRMNGQLEIVGLGARVFAQPGDSGSFVFLVEEDRSLTCIGMVEGFTTYYSTIVTPIKDILQKLELENMLYRFSNPPDMEVGN